MLDCPNIREPKRPGCTYYSSRVEECWDFKGEATAGCTYYIPGIEEHPTWLKSRMQREHQVVWLGASDTTGGHEYTNLSTLVEFYVIWTNPSPPSRSQAYKGTLSFGLSTLHTSIQSGITTTTESDLITDLDWRETEQSQYENLVSIPTISVTAPGDPELFWVDHDSGMYLKNYLSTVVFTGYGELNRRNPGGAISYTTDGARAVGESLEDSGGLYTEGGIEGLRKRLNILAVSMTNGLRDTSVMGLEKQQVLAPARRFEPYFDITWGWLALPIATVVMTLVLLSSTILLTLSPEVKEKLGDLRTNDRMEERLKKSGGMK
ncbi:MAG: hypothetical protein Q9184_008391, partial [Pyrenodesmia sp. 2 TL-2023]